MIFRNKNIDNIFTGLVQKTAGLFCVFLFFALSLKAQNANLFLNRELYNRFDGLLGAADVNFHTSIKPYQWKELKTVQNTDSVYKQLAYNGKSPALYALRNSSVIEYLGPKSNFSLNPYLGFNSGFNLGTNGFFNGSEIGAMAKLQVGDDFYLNATAIYGKSAFADYVDEMTKKTGVVIGNGFANSKSNKFNYHNYIGYASYSPSKYFNFQLGSDRNFIGEGYRSLLLSDNAKNYPFFKVTTSVWKLKYVNLFTNFKDVTNTVGDYSKSPNKFATIHYLSWNINKRINLGFFESIVFQNRDTTKKFGYDINYLNPIIFFRPVEYAMGSADNALMGLNYRVKLNNKMQTYGQVVIDEFLLSSIKADIKKIIRPNDATILSGWWANKYGFQFGYKWFDVLKIKNLQFQAEYNYVRPYTYSHGSVLQKYGHFNQALAHPLGSNFMEGIFFVRYYLNNVLFELKFSNAVYGEDLTGQNYGRDIFKSYIKRPSDYGNFTAQGLKTNLSYVDFKINYLINPKSNLTAELGCNNRYLSSSAQSFNTRYVYLGLRTAISNAYFDK